MVLAELVLAEIRTKTKFSLKLIFRIPQKNCSSTVKSKVEIPDQSFPLPDGAKINFKKWNLNSFIFP